MRGSIPACAGEPCCAAAWAAWAEVDPRVCGGARSRIWLEVTAEGRSPRVRGSLPCSRSIKRRRGSIPACAGEPRQPVLPWRRRKVDPRVCGGAQPVIRVGHQSEGRSPRVRGSQGTATTSKATTRSIPACAGEPSRPVGVFGFPEVDPRVCGGAHRDGIRQRSYQGRSPRVRGSRPSGVGDEKQRGSIPACAGEPARVVFTGKYHRVDPRVCGGAHLSYFFFLVAKGRSPRVRGSRLRPAW